MLATGRWTLHAALIISLAVLGGCEDKEPIAKDQPNKSDTAAPSTRNEQSTAEKRAPAAAESDTAPERDKKQPAGGPLNQESAAAAGHAGGGTGSHAQASPSKRGGSGREAATDAQPATGPAPAPARPRSAPEATRDGSLPGPSAGTAIDGTVPALPESEQLPTIDVIPAKSSENGSEATPSKLHGTWKQIGDDHSADFAEGGYGSSRIEFREDGVCRVVRWFGQGGGTRIVHHYRFEVKGGAVKLRSGSEQGPNVIDRPIRLGSDGTEATRIRPAASELPVTMDYKLGNGVLTIGNKQYERASE